MRPTAFFLAAPLLFLASAFGQDAQKEDPVAARLTADKKAFGQAIESARKDLGAAIGKAIDANNTAAAKKQITITVYGDRDEKLTADGGRVGRYHGLPAYPGLQGATSKYQDAVRSAATRIRQDFEKAAEAYRAAGDRAKADGVTEELAEYVTRGEMAAQGLAYTAGAKFHIRPVPGGWLVPEQRATTAGTNVVVTGAVVVGDDAYRWKVVSAGGSWFHLENVKAGLVLARTGKGNITDIVVAKKDPKIESQQWRLVPAWDDVGKPAFRLRNRATSTGLYVVNPRAGGGLGLAKWEVEPARVELFRLEPN